MKGEWVRRFIRLGRRGETLWRTNASRFGPGNTAAAPRHRKRAHLHLRRSGTGSGRVAGEISLRVGDSLSSSIWGTSATISIRRFRGQGTPRGPAVCARRCSRRWAWDGGHHHRPRKPAQRQNLPAAGWRFGCAPCPCGEGARQVNISLEKRRYIWFLDAEGAGPEQKALAPALALRGGLPGPPGRDLRDQVIGNGLPVREADRPLGNGIAGKPVREGGHAAGGRI